MNNIQYYGIKSNSVLGFKANQQRIFAQSIEKMTEDLKNYISEAEKASYEKEQMEAELKIAKTIQESCGCHAQS